MNWVMKMMRRGRFRLGEELCVAGFEGTGEIRALHSGGAY